MSVPSLQLYTVASALEADMAGTFARLARLGLRHVEAYDFVHRAEPLAAALADAGLSSPTGHEMLAVDGEFSFEGTTKRVPSHEEVFTAAETLGMDFVFDPAIFDWSTRERLETIAQRLATASEVAADHGIRVGYHTHAWEISSRIDGATAIEVFADLAPSIALEIDLYWAYIGGVDPVGLLSRLGERVVAVHVKDGPTVPDPFTTDDKLDMVALHQTPAGAGDVPLAEALAATAAQYAVIEFDHLDSDIFEGIAQSLSFLNGLSMVPAAR